MDKIVIMDSEGNQKKVNFINVLYSEKFSSTYIAYTESELTDGQNIIDFGKLIEKDNEVLLCSVPEEEKTELVELLRKELTNQ